MAAFATPAELATYLRTATQDEADAGNPDILDTLVATQLLDTASGYIRGECHWNISQETVTRRIRTESPIINLDTLRLTAVSSVAVGGRTYTTGYDFDDTGRVELWGVLTGWTSTIIEITYTHGYVDVPDAIVGFCLELAGELYPNPSRNLSETQDTVGQVFARRRDTPDFRLAPYRLPVVA